MGLYGASEGGLIAFRVAARAKNIAYGITISAPAVPHYQLMDTILKSLAINTGLKEIQIEKLVVFNRLVSDLVRTHNTIDFAELEQKVAVWNDPGWSQLISLLRKRTDQNREATEESFIKIAQKWEGRGVVPW